MVQEKNITYPTDDKLRKKIINKCVKIAEKEGLKLRQTYVRVLKKLSYDQRFRNHPKNKGKSQKADNKVKTIAGRLVRELVRKLPTDTKYCDLLILFNTILNQKRSDKNKIYSIHEPQVQCISKGKEHKKYEFGNKVSISLTQTTGVIVGAKGFRNPYDGHTLEPTLEQVEKLTGKKIKTATVDRGCKGAKLINGTHILIPEPFPKKITRQEKKKRNKSFSRRAAIEPVIGHLKSDHRLGRNFYKGVFGDNINLLLSAAAFNFKRMMNKWKSSLLPFFQNLVSIIISILSFLFKTQNKKNMVFKG